MNNPMPSIIDTMHLHPHHYEPTATASGWRMNEQKVRQWQLIVLKSAVDYERRNSYIEESRKLYKKGRIFMSPKLGVRDYSTFTYFYAKKC